MNCPNCGVTVAEEDLFCLNCGSRLSPSPASPVANYTQQTAPQPSSNPAGQKNNNKALLAVIAVLVIIIAAGVAAFFALGGAELFAKEEETTLSQPDAAAGDSVLVQGNTTTSHPVLKETTEFENLTTALQQDTTSAENTVTSDVTEATTGQSAIDKPGFTVPTLSRPDDTNTNVTAPSVQTDGNGYVRTSSGLMMPAEGNRAGICEAYNNAVNSLKGYQGTVTLHKEEAFNLYAEDLPVIIDSVVNGTLANLSVPSDETYTFRGGSDGEGRFISEKMMPWGRDAAVTEYDVISAAVNENEDGGYTITLYFPYEIYYYSEGSTWDEPTSHMTAMDYLEFSAIDFGAISITDSDMRYPGAITEMTVDSKGRLVELYNYMPLEGDCTCAYGFVDFELYLTGDVTLAYAMTYLN